MSRAELRVRDRAFSGWTAGDVSMAIDQLAHTFAFDYAHVPGAASQVEAQDECEVLIDGHTIVNGYVERTIEGASRRTAEGASRTVDLVPTSHIGPRSFQNASALTVASRVLEPFEIEVELRATHERANRPFQKLVAQRGESPFDLLSRAARRRGLLLTSENGKLLLESVGARETNTVIELGVNVMDGWEFTHDVSERFDRYRFKGQRRARGETQGRAAAHMRNQVRDHGMRRYRPFYVTPGAVEDERDLEDAATHLRNRAAGRSEQLTLTYPDYVTAERTPWRPNTLTRVRGFPFIDGEASLLVTNVAYPIQIGEQTGHEVALTLTRPEAYGINDYPVRERGEAWA